MESNVQKMKEALEDSQSLLESFSRGEYGAQVREQMRDNQAALSAPPRNCDVGSADEQHRRFVDYCNKCDCPMGCIHRKEFIGMLDTRCASMLKCYIRWTQMPYEVTKEGDAK